MTVTITALLTVARGLVLCTRPYSGTHKMSSGYGPRSPNFFRYLPAYQNSDSVVAQAFSASALTRAQRQEFCRPSRPLALDGDMSDEAAAAPDGARDPPAQLRALG